MAINKKEIIKAVSNLLLGFGEDPDRVGLEETPLRVASFYQEALSGYTDDFARHAKIFPNQGGCNLIIVKGISFNSLCEHHLLPFFGEVAIGYVPNKNLLGLSKFARITEVFARRLQVQERLTGEILNALNKTLQPLGCAVRIEANHLCMMARGVKSNNAVTITTAFSGKFGKNASLKSEFLNNFK